MFFPSILKISLLSSVFIAAASFAQAPASAPAGSTGLCKDGSYWSGATKRGACHGHKGVQVWYAGAPVATAAPSVAPAATPAAPAKTMPAPAVAAAPGGGPGQVWVNSSSKVYHCPSDRWYGKTKSGAYMSESVAIAQGNRPDHGKACSK
jgi:hypothetical protein